MIKSRRMVTVTDDRRCCGRCRFLRNDSNGNFICGIDGFMPAQKDLITLFTCRHYKEVRKDGQL